MQLPPVEVLLSWPTPNFLNPKVVRGPELLIITGIFFPLAVLMVILRIFTRLRISKAFGVDDVFLLAAVVPSGAIAVVSSLAMTHWGWNRHIWDVPFALVTRGLKLTIAMECLFGVAVSCTKISLLILTRRVISRGQGALYHMALFGIFIVACEGFVFNLVVIFTCSPVSDYWTLSLTPQKCINERTHLLIGGITNTLTDFLVFFLPLPTVLSLKIHRRQQVLISTLFGAGLIVCVAGTVRIWFAWKMTSSFDRTWNSYPLWISSVLELDIGIICTAIPACKPFFSRYLPSLLGTSFASTPKKSHSTNSTVQSNTNRQAAPVRFSREQFSSKDQSSLLFEPLSPFELQLTQAPKFGAGVNSKQMLPLSCLDISQSPRDPHNGRRISNETSISSFVSTGESPAATTPASPLPIRINTRANRVEKYW